MKRILGFNEAGEYEWQYIDYDEEDNYGDDWAEKEWEEENCDDNMTE